MNITEKINLLGRLNTLIADHCQIEFKVSDWGDKVGDDIKLKLKEKDANYISQVIEMENLWPCDSDIFTKKKYRKECEEIGKIYLSLYKNEVSIENVEDKLLVFLKAGHIETLLFLGYKYLDSNADKSKQYFKEASIYGIGEGTYSYSKLLPHDEDISNTQNIEWEKTCIKACREKSINALIDFGHYCHINQLHVLSFRCFYLAWQLDNNWRNDEMYQVIREWYDLNQPNQMIQSVNHGINEKEYQSTETVLKLWHTDEKTVEDFLSIASNCLSGDELSYYYLINEISFISDAAAVLLASLGAIDSVGIFAKRIDLKSRICFNPDGQVNDFIQAAERQHREAQFIMGNTEKCNHHPELAMYYYVPASIKGHEYAKVRIQEILDENR